jgi:copper ion binding protein
MIKALALLGIAAAGGLAICPLCETHTATSAASAVSAPSHVAHLTALSTIIAPPTTSVVTLRVTGMTCGGCVLGVRKVLGRLDGVTHADVSYKKSNAVVHFDSSKVTTAQMIAAIKTLGYTAVVAG